VSERDVLERLVAGVRAGQSRVLVLRGEAGVGKTALLRHLSAAADGCRIARAVGIESEMEFAFAGLHALCAPMLARLEHLPGPQCDALSTAFGLSAGPPPDRFLVGLAVLSLLAGAGMVVASLYGVGAGLGLVPALVLVLFLLLGVIFLTLGFVGEYVGRIYNEVRQRPRFVVRTVHSGRAGSLATPREEVEEERPRRIVDLRDDA